MESSFEQTLPPRERLELTVNSLFAEAELYDDITNNRISASELTECGGCGNCQDCAYFAENEDPTYEAMSIPGEQAIAVVIRELDSLGVPSSYIVGVRDPHQLSQGIAGLAWRPNDTQLLPRLFDQTKITTDNDETTATLLSDWLKAHVVRTDAESMPPNPFNSFYEKQRVTLGTLDGERMSDEELANFLRMGIVAAHYDEMYDALRTITQPLLPPTSYLYPEQ